MMPPAKAINTSQIVGEVRANSSDCASAKGVRQKCGNAEQGGNKQVLERLFDQGEIVLRRSEPYAQDRPHQRRDEHRPDDHRRRIDIQTDRSDERSKDQGPQIDPFEHHPAPDGIQGILLIIRIAAQTETFLEETFDGRP